MAQKPQIIDVTKSYIPGDPEAILENLVSTKQEDESEPTLPVSPIEGFNFLPTAYGYRSYFGVDSTIDIPALSSKAQKILSYQLPNFRTHFIALCEDGIWITDAANNWAHAVTLPVNTKYWSYCVIDNDMYMYQSGLPCYYKTNVSTGVLALDSVVPSFLNMAGQEGIFKAGTRLGFWDSMNSVSWSNSMYMADFTPSIETIAGNMTFSDVVGDIILIKEHGKGFIVYSESSIVGVRYQDSDSIIWDASVIFSSTGILSPDAVVTGSGESEHYVSSNKGFIHIGTYSYLTMKYDAAYLFIELFDFLKEANDPPVLTLLNKRYLCIEVFDEKYLTGVYPGGKYKEPVNNHVFSVVTTSLYRKRAGAFVYDLQYKKWGKYKLSYDSLIDYIATNASTYGTFGFTDLGITAGALINNQLTVFNTTPVDGYIKYGKIGYYRLGVVQLLETRVDFRFLCAGNITLEASLDGRNIAPDVTFSEDFFAVSTIRVYPNIRYKWYTITISGEYDITYMETRANISGRR